MYRLVISAGDTVPVAYAYATGAAPYSGPLGFFELAPFQELPQCQPGDQFDFQQPFANAQDVVATSSDGIMVRSAKLRR
jgi:hypothetical protein